MTDLPRDIPWEDPYLEAVEAKQVSLFHRLDREFPDTKTPEGAREVLHILAIREEIAKADRAFERAQKLGE